VTISISVGKGMLGDEVVEEGVAHPDIPPIKIISPTNLKMNLDEFIGLNYSLPMENT
jgi:hypothetical protein